jgi:hypothetical protein
MFDARHPQSSFHPSVPAPGMSSLNPLKLAPEVLGKVAECFSVQLCTLQRSLGELEPEAPQFHETLTAALAALARLEQFGLQIQELARVLGGTVPLPRERIDIADAARAALAEWTRSARAHAASSATPEESVSLDVNAAALAQLLDLGLEYALRAGSSIEVGAGSEGRPAQPTLTLTVRRTRAVAPAGFDEDIDDVHWLLFVQLARAVGLAASRLATAETLTLRLGFPSAVETPHDGPSLGPALLPHTASATGRRVLLLEPRDFVRVQAHRLMHDVGLRVDAASSIDQARAGLRDGPPDAVVTGIPVVDGHCSALLDEIRAEQPRLRVIELVDDDDAFSFSVPGSDSPARVGRNDLGRTLMRALSQELDAA